MHGCLGGLLTQYALQFCESLDGVVNYSMDMYCTLECSTKMHCSVYIGGAFNLSTKYTKSGI